MSSSRKPLRPTLRQRPVEKMAAVEEDDQTEDIPSGVDAVEESKEAEPVEDHHEREINRDDVDAQLPGFRNFLLSPTGKNRSNKAVNTLFGRMAVLLAATFLLVNHVPLTEASGVRPWLRSMVKDHSQKVFEHISERVIRVEEKKPATVLSLLDDINLTVKWFAALSGCSEARRLGKHLQDPYPFSTMMKETRKSMKRMLRIQRNSDQVSVEHMVETRCWPEGGLPELQDAVEKEFLVWIERDIVLKSDLNSYLNLLMAALYAFSPQGRIAGVVSLTLDQVEMLFLKGHAITSKLKTREFYGFQSVLIDKLFAARLLQRYIKCIRPAIVFSCGNASLNEGTSPLLLRGNGAPVGPKEGGRMIANFFKRTLGLTITSQTMRAIGETGASELLVEGENYTCAIDEANYLI